MLAKSALDASLCIPVSSALEEEAEIGLVAEGILRESKVMEMFHEGSLRCAVKSGAVGE
jgi:hypothetical protein